MVGAGVSEGWGQCWGQTWLPSFCQNTAGGGLPVVSHWKVTLRPGGTLWSWGQVTSWGGTGAGGRQKEKGGVAYLQVRWGAP